MDERRGTLAPGSGPAAEVVTVILVCGPLPEGKAISALSGRLADPDGRAVGLAVVPDLAAALAQPGNAPVVVLHRSAGLALSDAMAQGTGPSRVLASWMAAAASQLALLRRHRRRISLVDAAALSDGRLGDVLSRLAARLGLDVIAISVTPAAAMTDSSPLVTAVARICLADNADAQALSSELDALLLGAAEDPALHPDSLADAAFDALLMLQRDTGGPQARAERALLLDHLAHMQQQMEKVQAEADALDRLLHDSRNQAAAAEQAVQTLLAEAEARLAEAARVEARLAGERGVAKSGADPKVWTAERDLLLDQLAHMQMQVEQAQAEATAALRLRDDIQTAVPAVEAVAARAQRDALLGDEILRLGRAERALQDQVETLAIATALQLTGHEADLNRLRAAFDATVHDLEDARRELAAVYASRSWRITGPMRQARLAVTKKDNPDG